MPSWLAIAGALAAPADGLDLTGADPESDRGLLVPSVVAPPSLPAVTPEQLAIFHGTVAEADDFPEVVGLGVFGLTLCTGVVITDRLILTAAHCAVDLPPEIALEVGSAFFGPTPQESQPIGLVNMWLHPDYVRLTTDGSGPYTLGEADVALIELAEDAPAAPVWFRTLPFDDDVLGEEVTSVGFGLAEDGSAHTKRHAVLTLDELSDWHLVSKASTNDERASVCNGDSGGPKYGRNLDGELEVWGVHSWVSTNCKGESGSTRTDKVADWLLGLVHEVHGTTDVCELHARYDDGVCDRSCDRPDPDCPASHAVYGTPEQHQAVASCASVPSTPSSVGWLLVGAALGLVRRRC